MTTDQNMSQFEDIQIYREEYIRKLDQTKDKTEFALNNASSLYALGLTMYSRDYSFDSLVYNAFAMSSLDENIALHPEQRKILTLIHKNRGLIFSAPTSFGKTFRFLYKGIIIKHNKTEPTYTKTSLFLCEKRRFFMARTEKGVVTTI